MSRRANKDKRDQRLAQLSEYAAASRREYWAEVHRVERETADRSEASEQERTRREALCRPYYTCYELWPAVAGRRTPTPTQGHFEMTNFVGEEQD